MLYLQFIDHLTWASSSCNYRCFQLEIATSRVVYYNELSVLLFSKYAVINVWKCRILIPDRSLQTLIWLLQLLQTNSPSHWFIYSSRWLNYKTRAFEVFSKQREETSWHCGIVESILCNLINYIKESRGGMKKEQYCLKKVLPSVWSQIGSCQNLPNDSIQWPSYALRV